MIVTLASTSTADVGRHVPGAPIRTARGQRSRIRTVLDWAVFLLCLMGLWVAAAPTTLGGPASYVIVDGRSMEPTYGDGDLVIAYASDAYEIGDNIVYDAPIGTPFQVIHRITARTDGGYVTQGDNRDEPDGWIAPDDAIYGAARFHIPKGGTVVTFLRQPPVVFALVASLLTFELLKRSERKRALADARATEGTVVAR
jgi:signal peptidase I